MHIRSKFDGSKFDGGKQIIRSQGSAWNGRCAGATVCQNFGPDWGPKSWEKIMGDEANLVYTLISQKRSKLANTDRKRKATDKAKQSRWESKHQKTDDAWEIQPQA